ncbi:MAG: nucleoside-diphosphate kinase [Candidatus Marinimicrobia bacterium]|nr:nucleoside-diphosphate kinase [Candidatus Neomarinimicrobiota bacterium]
MNYTLSILKPDCIERKLTGEAIDFILKKGFEIKAIKMVKLTKQQAEDFYSVHKGKSFFPDLIRYMTSGPVIVMVLKKENAVEEFRKIIGATDPNEAEEGTLRKKYGLDVRKNFAHGSDSVENANKEIAFFFPLIEIMV